MQFSTSRSHILSKFIPKNLKKICSVGSFLFMLIFVSTALSKHLLYFNNSSVDS